MSNILLDGINSINFILSNKIKGCLVECGVQSGRFECLWISELLKNKEIRDIYMYDTFAGLTKPGKNDYHIYDNKLKDNNFVLETWKQYNKDNINTWCYCSLDDVKNKLNTTGYPQENLYYIKGDVMETLNYNIPDNIAVLRLDTDWYESSKFELEKLYNNVVKGGLIIFDDYYLWNGQKQAVDEFFSENNLSTAKIINLNNNQTAAYIKE
jgi:hypothetical protein